MAKTQPILQRCGTPPRTFPISWPLCSSFRKHYPRQEAAQEWFTWQDNSSTHSSQWWHLYHLQGWQTLPVCLHQVQGSASWLKGLMHYWRSMDFVWTVYNLDICATNASPNINAGSVNEHITLCSTQIHLMNALLQVKLSSQEVPLFSHMHHPIFLQAPYSWHHCECAWWFNCYSLCVAWFSHRYYFRLRKRSLKNLWFSIISLFHFRVFGSISSTLSLSSDRRNLRYRWFDA